MIQHSYVPCEFLQGVITPLVKDTEGDHCNPDNYRGLTLSVLLSNLFENAILLKIGHLLSTDSLQFGYKKRHSCSHAFLLFVFALITLPSAGLQYIQPFLIAVKVLTKSIMMVYLLSL